ncbi:MAG TPA: EutN/CcmL family microcompartment protein [Bacteroidota bacterium]|nr:EutN/CcmL family microcompartment protein [Bacteroidota bacterium]
MKLGVVIGVVWASRKVPELEGCRIYIVQPVSASGEPLESPLVAADPCALAAPGDRVVYVTSTDATQAFPRGYAPVNASIVELVEEVT